MHIKLKHHKTDLVQILNVDIDKYINFYVMGSALWLIEPTKIVDYDNEGNKRLREDGSEIMVNEKDILNFKTTVEAEYARDMIFTKLGSKAPENKILDLTVFDEMTMDDDNKYIDFNDIAQKFKTSPDKVRIVSVSNLDKSDEVEETEIIEDVDTEEVVEE